MKESWGFVSFADRFMVISMGEKLEETSKKAWSIQPVCKTCYYRRKFIKGGYATGDWENSVCDFNTITGNLRGCYPNGGNCECYRARGQLPQKSLGFKLK